MNAKIERRLKDLELKIHPKETKKPLQIIVVHDDEVPKPKRDGSEVLIIRVVKTVTSNPADVADLS